MLTLHVEERNNVKNHTKNDKKSVKFVLEKVSERYVRKSGAKSCIFRAKLDNLSIRDKQIKFKDLMTELDALFDDAIRQVRVKKALCVMTQSIFLIFMLIFPGKRTV